MKKGKIKLLFLTSVLGISLATIFAISEPGLSILYAETSNDSSTIWGHFPADPGTFETPGVREYWISCSNHEIVYSKPTLGICVDRNPLDYHDLYNEIKNNPADPRYNPPFKRIIDFESDVETYPFYDFSKSTNMTSIYVMDGVGYNGSRCLVAERNGSEVDRGIWFTKEYLNLVFSDQSIKAIEFDAKGENVSSNFRHRNSKGTNICYQVNNNGWGITKQWQTFSFTREMYEDIALTGGCLIYGQGFGKLYIDNIRPVSKDMVYDNITTKKYQTMDSLGQIKGVNTDGVSTSLDVFIYNPTQNTAELKIWHNVVGNIAVDYSTTVKSEGSRSLHIHKEAGTQICFGVTDRIIDSFDDRGITFDILTTQYVGPANFKKYQNRSSTSINGDYTLNPNKWTTVTVAKENIRDCTYDYIFNMCGTDGEKEMDIYIDNIRPATPVDNNLIIDFDDAGMFAFDTYREFTNNFTNNGAVNPINFNNGSLRDSTNQNQAVFWVNNPNGAGDVYLDGKHVSKGNQSLRFDIVDGSKGVYWFFNKQINNNLYYGDSVSFDVYSECDGNIQIGQAVTAGRTTGITVEPNKWTTLTFVKTDEKGEQFFRLHEGGFGSTGSFWIDNVRITRVTKGALEFERGEIVQNGNEYQYSYNGIDYDIKSGGNYVSGMSLYSGKIGYRNDNYLKFSKTNGYIALFLSKSFVDQIGSDGFSFDLYSTVAVNSKSGVGNFVDGVNGLIGGGNYQHPANKWVTYTFTKSMVASDGRFLIIQGSSAGDYYFDNFKILGSNVTYSDIGTYYIERPSSSFEVDTHRDLTKVEYVRLDNKVLSSNLYDISGSKIILNNITNGEHKLSYKIINGPFKEDNDNYYFAVYAASKTTDRNYALTYGSSGYQTIDNIAEAKRVVFGGKSIAFEQSGTSILIPDAALVECLETVGGSKVSGNYKLYVLSGSKNSTVTLVNVNITLSGTSSIKTGYTKRSDKTYGTFGYSSTSGGSSEPDLWNQDHFMEYQRSGLERVYEQTYSIPADLASNYFTQPNTMNPIQKDIARCEELGIKLLLCDSYIERMAQEQSSIIGRQFTIKSTSIEVLFNNTDELDAAIYERLSKYATSPAISKIVLCDEPRYYNLTAVGELYKSVRRCLDALNRQDVIINVNMLPISAGYGADGMGEKLGSFLDSNEERLRLTYLNYLNIFLNNTGAKEITYDIYPLTSKGVNEKSYTNLVVAAQFAKEHNVELHVVSETFTQANADSGTNSRVMSRDDMHYLLNMLMGFGVTEISFFTYYNRHVNSSEFHENGCMITETYDENGNLIGTEKTDVWYNVQTTNEEMNEFDEIMLNFKYQACYMYKSSTVNSDLDPNGYNKKAYQFVDEFLDKKSDLGNIKDISVSKEYAMFTSLVDGDGTYMYMIENCTDPQYNYVQTIDVTFKSGSYAAVYENGSVRYVNLSNSKLTVKLSSGNAAFVIIF